MRTTTMTALLLLSGCWDPDARDWTAASTDTGLTGDTGTSDDTCRDLNCDGWPDILVLTVHGTGQLAHAWLGGPAGIDPTRSITFDIGVASAAHVEDLDGDGWTDVVIVRQDVGYTHVYWGPDFTPEELDFGGVGVLCAEDVDGDGDTDLVMPRPNTDAGGEDDAVTAVFLNDDGFPTTPNVTVPAPGAGRCVVADRDGDGDNELTLPSTVPALDGTVATGTWWQSPVTETLSQQIAVSAFPAAGHLDQDNAADVVVPYMNSGIVDVFYGDGTTVQLLANRPEKAVIADVNNDGHNDLVLSSHPASGPAELQVRYGIAGGRITGSTEVQRFAVDSGRYLVVRDLDDDGFPDIVMAADHTSTGDYHGNAHVFWGSASGYDETRVTRLPNHRAQDVTVGDVDADGDLDLVFVQQGSVDDPDIGTWVYLATGSRTFDATPIELPLKSAVWATVVGG